MQQYVPASISVEEYIRPPCFEKKCHEYRLEKMIDVALFLLIGFGIGNHKQTNLCPANIRVDYQRKFYILRGLICRLTKIKMIQYHSLEICACDLLFNHKVYFLLYYFITQIVYQCLFTKL